MTDFLAKKPRLETVVSEKALDTNQPPQLQESSTSIIEKENNNSSNTENNLPECWSVPQHEHFKDRY